MASAVTSRPDSIPWRFEAREPIKRGKSWYFNRLSLALKLFDIVAQGKESAQPVTIWLRRFNIGL